MDYAKPSDVVTSMIDASEKELALAPRDLLIRGALLGAATALAFTGAVTTGQPLVGALIFPVSLVMIVLLGAKVSVYDWWVWNQIPVTLGNLVGGFVFTGLALYTTYKPAQGDVPAPSVVQAVAE
jgi:formate/nitrite transporter FocA (FNT family)